MQPAIQTILETLRQRWGDNALFIAGEARASRQSSFPLSLPTSEIDNTVVAPLGAYLQPGQLVEISGAPGSGKSALALALLRWALCREPCWDPCRAGSQYGSREGAGQGLAAYVDSPCTFYPPGAAAAGVDLSRLWIVRLSTWSAELAATEALLSSGAVDVVLWDLVGRRKTLTSGQLQRLRSAASPHGTLLILLTTQPPRSTCRPLDYGATVRLLVRRREFLWEQIGMQRLLAGYRLQVTVARAPGKPHPRPITLTLGPGEASGSSCTTPSIPSTRRAHYVTPIPPRRSPARSTEHYSYL